MSSDVAVVIGTYNGERHLGEQLRSVLEQTSPPGEVIVTDDGSTDGTRDVVEAVAARSPVEVRWVSSGERLGFADNFLSGAARTSRRLVAFCDQDDVWHPTKLEHLRAGLQTHGALAAAHAVRLIDADGKPLGHDDQGISRTQALPALTGNPWQKYYGFSMLFERWILDVAPADARGPDTHSPAQPLSHDRWVWFLASSLGPTLTVAERLAAYRQHGRQLYGSTGPTETAREKLVNAARHYTASIATAGGQAAFLADVCRQRSALLSAGAAGERVGTTDLQRAAQHWSSLASHYEARAALHSAQRRRDRLRAAFDVAGTGVYRSYVHGGLGWRALVQDATGSALPHRPPEPSPRGT